MNLAPSVNTAVTFALAHESGCFVDMLGGVRVTRGDGFKVRYGTLHDRNVVVVESGPGIARATKAAHALIDAHRPRLVIAAGFAGGLDSSLRRHDLVLADTLLDAQDRELVMNIAAIAPWIDETPDLPRGRLLTLNRIIGRSEEKRELGERHRALAVDMESFAVAEVCQARGVPLLVIRAISDALDDALPPDIGHLLSRKSLAGQFGAAIGSVARRPAAIKDLFRLHQSALECSARLAKFLTTALERIDAPFKRA